jgi:hypothetical protein
MCLGNVLASLRELVDQVGILCVLLGRDPHLSVQAVASAVVQ